MNDINQLPIHPEKDLLVLEWTAQNRHRLVLPLPENQQFSQTQGGLEVRIDTRPRRGYRSCCVTVVPNCEVEVRRVEVVSRFSAGPGARVLMNGYQSWTPTREWGRRERMTGLGILGRLAEGKYRFKAYGDYSKARYPLGTGRFHGYTYGYLREGAAHLLFASTSEAEGFTRFDLRWRGSTGGSVKAVRECRGLRLAPGRVWKALDLGWFAGTEDEVFDGWQDLLGTPARTSQTRKGWTSWYRHYQNISEAVIRQDLGACSRRAGFLDVFQIDDGWQPAVGDWDRTDEGRFPRGLAALAQDIRAAGFVPGLWLAPFAAQPGARVVADHPEWLLRDRSGRPVWGGHNWGGFLVLDPLHPGVRNHLRRVFSRIRDEWGFGLFKLDFLYAACLAPPPDRTAGQVMDETMAFLREICGDALMLACGVPLAPAFGRADYCRIGCDVGLDWDGSAVMRQTFLERVSTRNALGSMVFRRHLNGRVFLNDPDVWILRDGGGVVLTEVQRLFLYECATSLGGLSFTSDDLDTLASHRLADWERKTLPKGPGVPGLAALKDRFPAIFTKEFFR